MLKPAKLDEAAREAVRAAGAELLASFAYGRIFGPKFLGLFARGGINVHPSLLPRSRGPAPIQAAILAGDDRTGITVQKIAPEMDAGDILFQEEIPLSGRETGGVLSGIAAERGAALLAEVLRRCASGSLPEGRPQEGLATYSALVSREDARIDWNRSAVEIDRQVRAYAPQIACYTLHGGRELFILEGCPLPAGDFPGVSFPDAPPGTVAGTERRRGVLIQTGSGFYAALRLQYRARKALDWQAFLNGAHDFIGARLGGPGKQAEVE